MNRLVYLFELDSAKKSQVDIKVGQEALFEEIVLRGNRVVLTFNQITDSAPFIEMMMEKKQFPHILELFRTGYLQVSPYDGKNISQYLQEALENSRRTGQSGFIFSGVPVDGTETELITTIIHTLRYGNLALITTELEKARQSNKKYKEIKRLEYLRRYAELILILSLENLSGPMQSARAERPMSCLIRYICSRYNDVDGDLQKAIDCLKKCDACATSDSRSSWHSELDKMRQTSNEGTIDLAKEVVNLCYNYSIEKSIPGISHHYDVNNTESFFQDFNNRLKKYEERKNISVYQCADEAIDWELAVRILKRNQNGISLNLDRQDDDQNGHRYEQFYEQEMREWKKVTRGNARRYLLQLLKGSVVFGTYSLAAVFLSDSLDLIMPTDTVFAWITGCIIKVFALGLLEAVVVMLFKIPDILDIVLKAVQCIDDLKKIRKLHRGIAYTNLDITELS